MLLNNRVKNSVEKLKVRTNLNVLVQLFQMIIVDRIYRICKILYVEKTMRRRYSKIMYDRSMIYIIY